MLDREVDEVGINEDMVGWPKLRVVGEEEPYFLLFQLLNTHVVQLGDFALSLGGVVLLSLIFLDVLGPVIDLEASVLRVEHALNLCELARLCGLCHLYYGFN